MHGLIHHLKKTNNKFQSVPMDIVLMKLIRRYQWGDKKLLTDINNLPGPSMGTEHPECLLVTNLMFIIGVPDSIFLKVNFDEPDHWLSASLNALLQSVNISIKRKQISFKDCFTLIENHIKKWKQENIYLLDRTFT